MRDDSRIGTGDELTAFQSACGDEVARLLRGNTIPFQREQVEGQSETYLVFDVEKKGGDSLRIFVYEDEAGYFIGSEWHIWESADYDRPQDLSTAFLESLEATVKRRGS